MNKYLDSYKEYKNKIIDFLKETTSAFESFSDDHENSEALESLKKSIEDNKFEIVLVGEFSAGKSTFLNAIMGKRILPSYNEETTAAVTYLHDSKEISGNIPGIITYNDGKEEHLKSLSLKDIENAVSTRGKDIAKSVQKVDLYIKNNKFLADGVMLVDSPGLNGVAKGHREITEHEIKKANACIFVFNSDHPGSKTDFEFLGRLKKDNNNIFFVLNKIDRIRVNEGETPEGIAENLRRLYKSKFPNETQLPKIYPVSAQAALAARDNSVGFTKDDDIADTEEKKNDFLKKSKLPEFEDRLYRYLTKGEKTRDQFAGPVAKAIAFLNELKVKLENQNELLSSQKSSADLISRRNELEEQIRINEGEKLAKTSEISNEMITVNSELKAMTVAECDKLSTYFEKHFDNIITDTEMVEEAGKLPVLLQKKYNNILSNIRGEFDEKVSNIIENKFRNIVNEIKLKLSTTEDNNSILKKVSQINIDDIKIIPANLEQFRKDQEKLEKRLEELEKEATNMEYEADARAEKEDEAKQLYEKLMRIQNNRDSYIETFPIPEDDYYFEDVIEERDRGGFLGMIGQFFVGKKEVNVRVRKKDSTRKESAEKRLKKILEGLGNKENEVKEKIDNLNIENGKSAKYLDKDAKRIREEVHKMYKIISKNRNEFDEKMKKVSKSNKTEIKEYVNDYIESQNTAFHRGVRDYFENQRMKHVDVISSVINKGIDTILNNKKEELDSIIATLEKQGTEREAILEKNQKAIEKIKELLGKGIDLEASIETCMNDKIECDDITKIEVEEN